MCVCVCVHCMKFKVIRSYDNNSKERYSNQFIYKTCEILVSFNSLYAQFSYDPMSILNTQISRTNGKIQIKEIKQNFNQDDPFLPMALQKSAFKYTDHALDHMCISQKGSKHICCLALWCNA